MLDDSESDLRTRFSEFGEVKDVYLPKHKNTGKRKAFGFVEMTSQAEMDLAIERMNNAMIDGKPITCEVAMEERKSAAQMMEKSGRRRRGRSRSPPRRRRTRSRDRERRRSPPSDRRRRRDSPDADRRRRRGRSKDNSREDKPRHRSKSR